MSNEKKMRLIKDLKPYREEWRLTLKLIHSWKQFTSFGGDFQWKAGTQISHWYVKDDTETCKLTLLDTVATTIIGSKAVELWDGSFDEVILLLHFNILANS